MYLHDSEKCSGTLFLDLEKFLRLTSTFSIGSKGIVLGVGDLTFEQINGEIKNPTFKCSSCKSRVTVSEIKSVCFNCGAVLNLSKLIKFYGVSGLYCSNCKDDLKSLTFVKTTLEGTPALQIFSKLYIKE